MPERDVKADELNKAKDVFDVVFVRGGLSSILALIAAGTRVHSFRMAMLTRTHLTAHFSSVPALVGLVFSLPAG
jgi:hypothetical protein